MKSDDRSFFVDAKVLVWRIHPLPYGRGSDQSRAREQAILEYAPEQHRETFVTEAPNLQVAQDSVSGPMLRLCPIAGAI